MDPSRSRRVHHVIYAIPSSDQWQQAIDTTTPTGKLMFQITGAFAEFERSMIQQRVKLGLKRAVAQGKHLGRPPIASELERKAQRQLRTGTGILKVAKMVGLGTGTVHRIKRENNAPVTVYESTSALLGLCTSARHRRTIYQQWAANSKIEAKAERHLAFSGP